MRFTFSADQITAGGAWRGFYQDQVILNAGLDFGKMPDGRHFIRKAEEMDMAVMLAMIGDAVEIDELPVIVRAPATILEEPVYEGLPFREKEEDQVHTFGTWGGEIVRSIDEQEICLILTLNGRHLKGSEWAIFDDHALELMQVDEYHALMETANWKREE